MTNRRIRNRPEQDLQIAVAQYLDRVLPKDAVWFHVPNAAKRGIVAGVMNKKMGVKAGVPDIFIFYVNTSARYGRTARCIAIELKAKAGKLSKAQLEMSDALYGAGVMVYTARMVSEVELILKNEGLIRGNHKAQAKR